MIAVCTMDVSAQAGNNVYETVQAPPGTIVLQRNVAPRIAYRQAPPGMASVVDPSPRGQIDQTLGTGELSDADYSSMGAGSTSSNHPANVGMVLNRTLGIGAGNQGVLSGQGISNMMGGPMGAISGTTRGVGDQISGALAQFPMLGQPSVGH
ncbi:hypothetical protein [Dyella silvatica]|uniref:hypothetical protein n=1 Tax=Dyella silvatica TaxID=2992128 RepID=UPI002254DF3D|nr:hypothetical protein [Dyella silvatica]